MKLIPNNSACVNFLQPIFLQCPHYLPKSTSSFFTQQLIESKPLSCYLQAPFLPDQYNFQLYTWKVRSFQKTKKTNKTVDILFLKYYCRDFHPPTNQSNPVKSVLDSLTFSQQIRNIPLKISCGSASSSVWHCHSCSLADEIWQKFLSLARIGFFPSPTGIHFILKSIFQSSSFSLRDSLNVIPYTEVSFESTIRPNSNIETKFKYRKHNQTKFKYGCYIAYR